jgi:hypothetical protein
MNRRLQVVCTLAPLALALLWRSPDGVRIGLACLFLASATLAAAAFGHVAQEGFRHAFGLARRAVGSTVALFLVAEWAVRGNTDPAAMVLAVLVPLPVLAITPYLTLVTRRPMAAVVFTAGLLLLAKALAGTVVVTRYGWDADRQGETAMPWLAPNLMVWAFGLITAAECVIAHYLMSRLVRLGRLQDAA